MKSRSDLKEGISTRVGEIRRRILSFFFLRWMVGVILPHEHVRMIVDQTTLLSVSSNKNSAGLRSYAQNFQDLVLLGAIDQLEMGEQIPPTFIEIGGGEPHQGSNSFVLELLGWRGIVLEPIPTAYELIKQERESADVRILPFAVGSESGTATMRDEGIHSQIIRRKRGRVRTNRNGHIDVAVITPQELMEMARELGLLEIGVVLIDAEGSELDIMRNWDWSLSLPRFFLLEHNYNIARYWRLKRILHHQGYAEFPCVLLKQDALFYRAEGSAAS